MTNDNVKILIVDDEPRNLDALEAMLEASPCSFVRAQSADEALLALLKHDFAAMILDIRMPGIGGIELAHLVKQRRRTRDVPILFLTAHLVEDEDVLRGYGVGAVDYLSKPIKADILRSKVAVFVDLYRKTRELAELNETLRAEVEERQKAQEALLVANQELERRVAERTAALNEAHMGVLENEERLRMSMDVGQIAAWDWDIATGRMTWSTDPEALFGFPSGAFGPELRILRAVHPEDRRRVESAVTSAFRLKSTYECEYRAVRPDGIVVWVTERGRVLETDEGVAERMVGVSRDISAQRRVEQERERLLVSERRARDEAERQSRLKDEFLATLSHELRTPMNAIMGWASMLAKGEMIRDPRQVMAVIQRNAETQAKLIEDLLEMNKLGSGAVRLELRTLDIRATLDAAIQAVKPTADAKGIQLTATFEPLPQMFGDERRIQQILWNLLSNGIKFTPASGSIDVNARGANGSIEVLVKDTGQGIAPDFLPYVFDRFRQADPSMTRDTWGLGIGLSIVKHLVELHGGTIEAASPGLGLGSTFKVTLPLGAPVSAGFPKPDAVEVSDARVQVLPG